MARPRNLEVPPPLFRSILLSNTAFLLLVFGDLYLVVFHVSKITSAPRLPLTAQVVIMSDEREEEVSTIQAIYPELIIESTERSSYRVSLELPVNLPEAVPVLFEDLLSPANLGIKHLAGGAVELLNPSDPLSLKTEQKLSHLPSIHLKVTLPSQYPADSPPQVKIHTTPAWLPGAKARELEEEVEKLWEDYGHCQILFAYIDYLQQAAEQTFDLPLPLSFALPLKSELVQFDRKTKKQLFHAETFDCGVCLEPKKGSSCYRMERCGHVFCLSCLQDFYNNAITEGDVVNVKCLDPGCGKSKVRAGDNERARKTRTVRTLHPRELLSIGISEPAVRRYVDMKRKKKLETDKSTVYCPRTWCQAPARSAKYPPIPADLSQYPDSESDSSDAEQGLRPAFTKDTPENRLPAPGDRLAICSNPKCSLAFCSVCYSGWHGEFARCWPRNPGELSAEERASYDYIRLHTSPCPTCSSPTQKTMGCNHMNCFQCNTHFCYLCGAWLDPGNPYNHFNNKHIGCYMRLWELEEGDEGHGRVQFEGPRRWEAEARLVAEEADREEAMRLQEQEDAAGAALPEAPAPPPAQVEPALIAAMARVQLQQPLPPPPAQQRRGAGRPNGQPAPRGPNAQPVQQLDPAQAAAFPRFLAMAANDEEDGWNSDELEDDEMWEIRAR